VVPIWKLRQNEALRYDFCSQLFVFCGIDDIDAAAENGNGGTAGREARPVSDGVDAPRHAGDDGDAGAGEVSRQAFRSGDAVGRGAACSDNSDTNRRKEFDAAACEKEGRGIVDPPEGSGVTRIRLRDEDGASIQHHFALAGGVFEAAAARDRTSETTGKPGGFEFTGGSAEDGLRGPESLEQLIGAACSESRNKLKGKPVEFVFRREGGRGNRHA
jgi:hypothetical protein